MNLPPLNCSGCTKCCTGDKIVIMPDRGDVHKRWKTDFDRATGQRTLKRDAKGNCVYLRSSGCSIYGKQPYMCRIYDCRLHYLYAAKVDPDGSRDSFPGFVEGRRRVEAIRAEPAPSPMSA